jgi:PAS domain S-box-containing protein
MPAPIRILHLEDNPHDAELVRDRLEADGLACEITWVQSREHYESALAGPAAFDVILCDFNLGGYDGFAALKLALEKQSGAPVIMVSGSLRPEEAVASLKLGATDYLFKERLERLVSAVNRAIVEAREHYERQQAEAELAQFKHTLDQTLDCVFMFRSEDLRFTYANEGAKRQVGYGGAELLGMTPLDIKPEFTPESFRQLLRPLLDGTQPSLAFQTLHRHKAGHDIPVEVFLQLVHQEGREPRFVAIVRDITARKLAEEENRLLLAFTQTIAEAENFNSALAAALQMVSESTAWDFGEAWIPSSAGTYLELSSSWYCRVQNVESFRTVSDQFTFAPGVGLPGRVWVSKKPAWIPDVTVDPNFSRALFAKEVGFHAAVGIPILAANDVVAVLCFFLRQLRHEDGKMVALVSAVAAQLGTLFQRKRTEEALRKSHEDYRRVIEDIFKFVPEALLVFTRSLNLFKDNQAFEDLVRTYAPKLNYTEPELRETLLQEIRAKVLSGGAGEIRIPPKNRDEQGTRGSDHPGEGAEPPAPQIPGLP